LTRLGGKPLKRVGALLVVEQPGGTALRKEAAELLLGGCF